MEKLSQRSQNVTVKGKEWPCTAKGSWLHCLAGSRCRLADSSYAVLKSVKAKQTLHCSVLLIQNSVVLCVLNLSLLRGPMAFFFSLLSGVESVMKYSFKYCRRLKILYYEWSMPTTVASPLLVCSTKKIKTIEPMDCVLRSVFFCVSLGSYCDNISICIVNFYNSLE